MRAIFALNLLAVMVLCSGCDKAPESAPAPVEAPRKAAVAVSPRPAAQEAFIRGVALAESGGADGQAFCAEFQKTQGFENWIGTIADFRTSTVNGSIDITFDMGGVRFEQVVQKSNPAYASVESLLVGARAELSGQFSHGNSECGYSLRTISIGLKKVRTI